jgi:ribosomal protein S18 acetylase RimI-like enzyme
LQLVWAGNDTDGEGAGGLGIHLVYVYTKCPRGERRELLEIPMRTGRKAVAEMQPLRKKCVMEIRKFEIRDEVEVIALWEECNLVVPWNDPKKDIQRKLKVNPELFLVGILDGRIVASIMGGYEGHRGWVNYLAVSPSIQRKGYGRQMMEVVETKLREVGCPKINLQVRDTNKGVIAFYKAIGYDPDNVISMGKRLESDE